MICSSAIPGASRASLPSRYCEWLEIRVRELVAAWRTSSRVSTGRTSGLALERRRRRRGAPQGHVAEAVGRPGTAAHQGDLGGEAADPFGRPPEVVDGVPRDQVAGGEQLSRRLAGTRKAEPLAAVGGLGGQAAHAVEAAGERRR